MSGLIWEGFVGGEREVQWSVVLFGDMGINPRVPVGAKRVRVVKVRNMEGKISCVENAAVRQGKLFGLNME